LFLHKAKIKELRATTKKLSEECDKAEVDIHTLKNRELANKEEIRSLKSTILELKKKIAIETEGQQHLLVKKSQAETGMCGHGKQGYHISGRGLPLV
jgi:predicted RNase H-like nuclease (RuvC/YqgF family)